MCQRWAVGWDVVRASYDTVARDYETRFVDELRNKPRDRELLERFTDSVGDPVVDVGCGPGQIGAFIRGRGRRVAGVDFSPQMARLALDRLDAAVTADMRALPLADQVAGGIVAFYSLIHLPRADLLPALRELRRVLRPGGRVLFSAHEGRGEVELEEFIGRAVPMIATFFELDELTTACAEAGLEVESAERRQPYSMESTVRLYVEAIRP